jgi:hypothetical protein
LSVYHPSDGNGNFDHDKAAIIMKETPLKRFGRIDSKECEELLSLSDLATSAIFGPTFITRPHPTVHK